MICAFGVVAGALLGSSLHSRQTPSSSSSPSSVRLLEINAELDAELEHELTASLKADLSYSIPCGRDCDAQARGELRSWELCRQTTRKEMEQCQIVEFLHDNDHMMVVEEEIVSRYREDLNYEIEAQFE